MDTFQLHNIHGRVYFLLIFAKEIILFLVVAMTLICDFSGISLTVQKLVLNCTLAVKTNYFVT